MLPYVQKGAQGMFLTRTFLCWGHRAPNNRVPVYPSTRVPAGSIRPGPNGYPVPKICSRYEPQFNARLLEAITETIPCRCAKTFTPFDAATIYWFSRFSASEPHLCSRVVPWGAVWCLICNLRNSQYIYINTACAVARQWVAPTLSSHRLLSGTAYSM